MPVAGEPAGRPSAITRGSTYVRSRSKPSAEYRLWPWETTPRSSLSGGPVIVSVPSTIAAIVGADSNSVQLLVDVRAPGAGGVGAGGGGDGPLAAIRREEFVVGGLAPSDHVHVFGRLRYQDVLVATPLRRGPVGHPALLRRCRVAPSRAMDYSSRHEVGGRPVGARRAAVAASTVR